METLENNGIKKEKNNLMRNEVDVFAFQWLNIARFHPSYSR